jgi:hypothetical protein
MYAVAKGEDPQAEKRARHSAGTFAELAERYREDYAQRRNKSWKQADKLVRRYLLPGWAKLEAKAINRSHVRLTIGRIAAPVLANQVLAAASAIFSWAVKQEVIAVNPCHGIERHKTTSRERVLSDSELPLFWEAFDRAGLAGMRSSSSSSLASVPARWGIFGRNISSMAGGKCRASQPETGPALRTARAIACGCRNRRKPC